MTELNRIVKSGGYGPAHRPPAAAPQEMPQITQAVLDRIPVVYWEGLQWMQQDGAGFLDQARIAVAVNDAIRTLSTLGRQLEAAGWTADQLFRIRPTPIAPGGDYKATRKLRFEDEPGADLPIRVCATAGLLWRLNGGQVCHWDRGHIWFVRNGANFRFGD
jgi:hypothetical protein